MEENEQVFFEGQLRSPSRERGAKHSKPSPGGRRVITSTVELAENTDGLESPPRLHRRSIRSYLLICIHFLCRVYLITSM